jgi:hypothetical protein
MHKQCARPGCSASASVTFTFDSRACTVWLDPVSDGGARAGDLCERHAARLVPPKGWGLVDRRRATAAVGTSSPPAPVPAPAWAPDFDPADDLGGLLDASTPLLGRAFRNLRAV